MSIEKIILTDEAAVFVLEKGSQYKGQMSEGIYYTLTLELLQKMQENSNVQSDIIGFSGTMKDMAVFLSKILISIELSSTHFSIQTDDIDDFNPNP